jgi:glycosyltransferase involved in cell wall biosynthesis
MGQALQNQVLLVYPEAGRPFAGGPEGFITQLLRPFEHPHFQVTPPLAPQIRANWKKHLLRHLPSRPWQVRHLLTQPATLLHHATFRQTGMHLARYLWFMDHSLYRQYEPFIHPDQVVIYQPHCPQLPWEEVPDDSPTAAPQRAEIQALIHRLTQRATHLVFPNTGAQSIYTSLIRPHHQIHHLPSAAACPETLRPIPLDPSLTHLLYIGRRLPIKGFDLIRTAFAEAHATRPDLRLILCGEGPQLPDPGLIDIGFTTRIHDWIASADCVLNANRQSYLDLSLMETLAIGTPIVMTATHGHEGFRRFASRGIHCLHSTTVSELTQHLKTLTTAHLRSPLPRTENQALYQQAFTPTSYHQRLTQFVDQLLHP